MRLGEQAEHLAYLAENRKTTSFWTVSPENRRPMQTLQHFSRNTLCNIIQILHLGWHVDGKTCHHDFFFRTRCTTLLSSFFVVLEKKLHELRLKHKGKTKKIDTQRSDTKFAPAFFFCLSVGLSSRWLHRIKSKYTRSPWIMR